MGSLKDKEREAQGALGVSTPTPTPKKQGMGGSPRKTRREEGHRAAEEEILCDTNYNFPLPEVIFGLEIPGPSYKFGPKISKFMKHAAHSGRSRLKLARFVAKMLQRVATAPTGGRRIP